MGPQRKSKTLAAATKCKPSSSQYEEEQPAIPMQNQNPNPNPHQSSDESSDSREKTPPPLKSHTKKAILLAKLSSASAHRKKSASQETIPTQEKPIENCDKSSDDKCHEKQGEGLKRSVTKKSGKEKEKEKEKKKKRNELGKGVNKNKKDKDLGETKKDFEEKGTIGKDEIVKTLKQKEKRLKVELERTRLEFVKEQTEDLIKSFSYVTE